MATCNLHRKWFCEEKKLVHFFLAQPKPSQILAHPQSPPLKNLNDFLPILKAKKKKKKNSDGYDFFVYLQKSGIPIR